MYTNTRAKENIRQIWKFETKMNERTPHTMGLAFRSVGMKRGSILKSLHTKRKVTKAKR